MKGLLMRKTFEAHRAARGGPAVFACPMCLRDTPDPVRAHVWPKALGGDVVTLSCAACDKSLGSKVDSHLTAYAHANDVGNGRAKQKRVLMRVGGSTSRGAVVELHWPKQGDVTITPVSRASNPRDLAELSNAFVKGETDWRNLSFTLRMELGYSREGLRRAYAHSAYLEMFRVFGYEWVGSECAALIRSTLQTEAAVHLPLWASPESGATTRRRVQLALIREPVSVRGYLVRFPPTGDGTEAAMWLPLFGAASDTAPTSPPGDLKVWYLDKWSPELATVGLPGARLQRHALS